MVSVHNISHTYLANHKRQDRNQMYRAQVKELRQQQLQAREHRQKIIHWSPKYVNFETHHPQPLCFG